MSMHRWHREDCDSREFIGSGDSPVVMCAKCRDSNADAIRDAMGILRNAAVSGSAAAAGGSGSNGADANLFPPPARCRACGSLALLGGPSGNCHIGQPQRMFVTCVDCHTPQTETGDTDPHAYYSGEPAAPWYANAEYPHNATVSGRDCYAGGGGSNVAGVNASDGDHGNCFVWSGSEAGAAAERPGEVVFMAPGGVTIWTNEERTTGMRLPPGGSAWVPVGRAVGALTKPARRAD